MSYHLLRFLRCNFIHAYRHLDNDIKVNLIVKFEAVLTKPCAENQSGNSIFTVGFQFLAILYNFSFQCFEQLMTHTWSYLPRLILFLSCRLGLGQKSTLLARERIMVFLIIAHIQLGRAVLFLVCRQNGVVQLCSSPSTFLRDR